METQEAIRDVMFQVAAFVANAFTRLVEVAHVTILSSHLFTPRLLSRCQRAFEEPPYPDQQHPYRLF